jgi:hypothetical protein
MPTPRFDAEARRFFDEFVTAFAQLDGPLIAQRYIAPYVAMHAGAECQVFVEHRAIGVYFQHIVDGYAARGCCACRWFDLEVHPLGRDAMLATVSWELLRADGSVISRWRESYNLAQTREGWRIFASTDHSD